MDGQTTSPTTHGLRRDVRVLINPYKSEVGAPDGALTKGGIIEMVLAQHVAVDLQEDEISVDDSSSSGIGSRNSPTYSENI